MPRALTIIEEERVGRYRYCRVCGTELEGFTILIGACHSCVGDSNRRRVGGIPVPSYSWRKKNGEE